MHNKHSAHIRKVSQQSWNNWLKQPPAKNSKLHPSNFTDKFFLKSKDYDAHLSFNFNISTFNWVPCHSSNKDNRNLSGPEFTTVLLTLCLYGCVWPEDTKSKRKNRRNKWLTKRTKQNGGQLLLKQHTDKRDPRGSDVVIWEPWTRSLPRTKAGKAILMLSCGSLHSAELYHVPTRVWVCSGTFIICRSSLSPHIFSVFELQRQPSSNLNLVLKAYMRWPTAAVSINVHSLFT